MRGIATLILGAAAVGCTGQDEGTDTFTHPFESQHDDTTDPTNPTNPTNPTDPTDPTDTQTPTDPGDLHGQVPANPLPLPQFTQVVSRSGAPASPDDLVGQRTVLWFYPAAFTGG